MTLFERVFGGNDAVYGLTEAALMPQSQQTERKKQSASRTLLTHFRVTML